MPTAPTRHDGTTSTVLYHARRLRDGCFPRPELLFGEPAWDMLLDLHSAMLRGQLVSLKSACLGARTPATTGRRYLATMEQLGLIEIGRHPIDERALVAALTPDAAARMEAYLARLAR